ncbi:hypothetical protein ACH5RR_039750 [Cinchona calisaya]|uniref:Neprosin PEP catalytic domain-containing protein n=1 Tax=Cinchona calisaya TaxID=153742 RepID=A0ABD2Y473_9GENT
MFMENKLMAILSLQIGIAIISHGVLANDDSHSRQKFQGVASNDYLQNPNVAKSIHSEDGDIIDCVDIYGQPAFHHPALKNHRIQRSGSCPEGIVPIRRMQKTSAYKARKPSFFNPSKELNFSTGIELLKMNYLANGSVETGCFYQFCPGFVQVNREIALGAAIHPVSTVCELPYPIIIYIFKVNYGKRINIGYWPGEIFSSLRVHAQTVQWGGEVYSSRIGINHPHTKTRMGNGDFSYVNDSGSVKRIRIIDNSLVLKYPGYTYPYADEITVMIASFLAIFQNLSSILEDLVKIGDVLR